MKTRTLFHKSTFLVTTLLVAGLLGGCGLRVTNGSGNIITEERPVSDFRSISLEGAGEIPSIRSGTGGF